ncbi:hypothetical protein N5C46_10525 [Rossellomorea vietnamensis]|uniref:Uncharacterized protein n=1 Tax=Rossellomorea vietnamensis TaxID=218284 RepID=A0ACD4CD37_9BACI|nr:hypothetical protein [Rossellomorea vietnamensis]UXH46450.1 hypothetical protein N5C46_10525 [Rossellomorea vietnamensis]
MKSHSISDQYEKSESLLKYYNAVETSSTFLKVIPVSTTETGLEVPLSLKRICPGDQIELIATINWLAALGGTPIVAAQQFLSTEEVVTTVQTNIHYLLEVPIVFTVYRDGVFMRQTMDFRTLLFSFNIPSIVITDFTTIGDIVLRPLSPTITGAPPSATTTFQCLDKNPLKSDHVYSITAQIPSFSLVTFTPVLSTTSTEVPLIPIRTAWTIPYSKFAAVSSVHFTGKVIVEKNEDN